jgi:hypothetical protein
MIRRDDGLELSTLWGPTTQVVEKFLERESHLDFVVAGPHDIAADRPELGAGALRVVGPRHLPVPLAAVHEDMRHRGQRLDVVDRRRHAERPKPREGH